MIRSVTWKSRAVRGGLAGAVFFGVAFSIAVLLWADTYPELKVEDFDPYFIKHAMLVLLPFGVYSGAVFGGVTTNTNFS